MVVTGSISKARKIITSARAGKKIVGFVPTMGALHEGHLSLVRAARGECDFVCASIFVNPTQFGPGEDYKKYPRKFARDRSLLKKERVNLIFYPDTETMYNKDFSTYVEEEKLSQVLCGSSRPTHFRGVCTVVAKLFNIVFPDIAYFGQKDYQQAQIIKRMVADLNFPIKIKVLPTIREAGGLAISSRNAYLDAGEKKDALCLYSSLKEAKRLIESGERNPTQIIDRMKSIVESTKSAKIDYIEIVDATTLENLKTIKDKVLIALAVYIGKTRLIDNIILNVNTRRTQ